ncbi:AAA family ATPase, partial [candidate division GN15 bacterium]|nr:AAA family ATPase [candidate division GN15 bacterium]
MFTGRQGELGQLSRAIESTRSGQGQTVLVSGESGIGKSRLVIEALDNSGLLVLRGRSREGTTPPYGPLAAALREYLVRFGQEVIDDLPYAASLGFVLPELGKPEPTEDFDTVVNAVASLLDRAGHRQPMAVVIEDLHWSDNASLELLADLADRIRTSRVILIGTYRSDEVSRQHPVRRLRSELRRGRLLHEISLSPLYREDVAAILEHELDGKPSPELVELVCERSQGIPLYAEELVRSMVDRRLLMSGDDGMKLMTDHSVPIPEGVRDSVLLRVDSLAPEARTLV